MMRTRVKKGQEIELYRKKDRHIMQDTKHVADHFNTKELHMLTLVQLCQYIHVFFFNLRWL